MWCGNVVRYERTRYPHEGMARPRNPLAKRLFEASMSKSCPDELLRLRPKLEINPSAPRAIQTERRVGHVFRTALKMMRT